MVLKRKNQIKKKRCKSNKLKASFEKGKCYNSSAHLTFIVRSYLDTPQTPQVRV